MIILADNNFKAITNGSKSLKKNMSIMREKKTQKLEKEPNETFKIKSITFEMKNSLNDVKSTSDMAEGGPWNLKADHEKSLLLIHKEVKEGGLERGAGLKYLQSNLAYVYR